METIKKFVVIGPESTGKSTLCSQLAEYYQTAWVREYARGYLEKSGTNYSYDDLLIIAKGQIELEEEGIRHQVAGSSNQVPGISNQQSATSFELPKDTYKPGAIPAPELTARSSRPLFIDTDMYVMKVWCEYVFNKCHNWILNRIAERKYDGYLLCNADLPWVKDNLREYPDPATRNKLYLFYKDIMVNQPVSWVDISGSYEERFEKALNFTQALLHT